jgi:prolyl oligopeptidase
MTPLFSAEDICIHKFIGLCAIARLGIVYPKEAWKRDSSGFFYTRYPKPGEVPAGKEVYHRRVFYHALGSDPAKDPLIFGKDLGAEDWPVVGLSTDDHWLLIAVYQGWTKSELFLQNLQAGSSPTRITDGKNSSLLLI